MVHTITTAPEREMKDEIRNESKESQFNENVRSES
jgi:hypothetical protein